MQSDMLKKCLKHVTNKNDRNFYLLKASKRNTRTRTFMVSLLLNLYIVVVNFIGFEQVNAG